MFTSEVVRILTAEGYRASQYRVRRAIRGGFLRPKPCKNALGAFIFREVHLDQLRFFMVHSAPGPRPRIREHLPVNDSVRRQIRRWKERNQRLGQMVAQLGLKGQSNRASAGAK